MEGVVFDFAENAEHFEMFNYERCRVYIPKSQKHVGHNKYYFWSRHPGRIYFGRLGYSRTCLGKFFSILNKEEKAEFISTIMPEVDNLKLSS